MEEKSSQSVKLSSLKPHFLFNALNSVKCEVISDASDKVDLLDDFAAYLRYILRFSENNNVISAKEIVAFLGSYIRLEEARYDQIRIIFEVETLHFQMEALTLFELIYNAIHHGLGGNAPDGKVWVRIQKGKGEVIIEIEDNGKGIDPAILPIIFEGQLPTGDHAASDGKRSMGIGLSVCMSIIQAHQGDMKAENMAAHRGARIQFWLPCQEENWMEEA